MYTRCQPENARVFCRRACYSEGFANSGASALHRAAITADVKKFDKVLKQILRACGLIQEIKYMPRQIALIQSNVRSVPSALPRQTLVGSAVSDLRKRISGGEFKEGEPLNQVVIAREYTISRIPLREAMRQLEAEGLLVFQPYPFDEPHG
jgi:hypothetical protein